MESVQEILSHPYANMMVVAFGMVMLILGFFMIIRKGLALLFALLIFSTGIMSLTYVYKGSDIDFLNNAVDRFGEAGSKMPDIRDDVLRSWCEKLDP